LKPLLGFRFRHLLIRKIQIFLTGGRGRICRMPRSKFNAKNSARKFNTQNSTHKIQRTKYNAQNSTHKIQRARFNAQNSTRKILDDIAAEIEKPSEESFSRSSSIDLQSGYLPWTTEARQFILAF
jgi:hypothetical protein